MTKQALKNSIKLAAFDIDGTILPYTQSHFSDTITKMFKELKNKNIYSTLATAREFVTIGNLAQNTPDLDYFIGANGMFVYDFKLKKMIYEKPIALSELKIIHSAIQNIDQAIGMTITDLNWCYYTEGTDINTWFLSPHYSKMKPMDFNMMDKDHLHIITIMCKNKQDTEITVTKIKEVIKQNNLDLDVNSTWHKGLFICPKNVTKSDTIDWLANYLGLKNSKNVIAFGDSSNDFEMVKNAAWGVAMEECDPELKKVAKDIAKSVKEDDVYLKLKELNLI
ncbi:HAD family hydrolase [Mycoplasmopsis californica]|uniref:HAD family hydrolase n=1 Tax=Mycoplasmopsis californica TaxID=2113 RepID=A0A059XRJ3_9BACT|nr:HAD family hydrolase [Mycoplasmopsis californica]AIA29413.1 HAD family hydrolase [Mycoplasmopsis californica]